MLENTSSNFRTDALSHVAAKQSDTGKLGIKPLFLWKFGLFVIQPIKVSGDFIQGGIGHLIRAIEHFKGGSFLSAGDWAELNPRVADLGIDTYIP